MLTGKIDQVLNLNVKMNGKSIKQQDKLYEMIIEFSNKITKQFPDSQIVIASDLSEASGICLQDREKY
jgi:hypothetical protein